MLASNAAQAVTLSFPSFDYGLLAVQAIQSPNLTEASGAAENNNFVLHYNSFIQSYCPFDYNAPAAAKETLVSKAAPQIAQPVKLIAGETRRVIVTAYSSTPDQTDSTPFITANGKYVYDGLIACNFLPFGTKVRLPEVFGDKIFSVNDRMAKYNSHKIDVWMTSRELALQFGVKTLAVEILE